MKLNLNPKFDKEIIKNLSKFLLEKFCELDICSIFIFGSSIYPGYLNEGYSDIDVGVNVKNFERENLPKIYKSLNKINNIIIDKKPIFYDDMILPRFEMNIKFNNEKIDINVFPNNFLDFTKGWNDPIHDNIDSIIGSFIFNSIVIFGERPFIDNNTIDFTPFYSDVIRNERMYKLINRIKSYCDYISNEKQYSSKVLTAYIKLRTYFFKYCFIKDNLSNQMQHLM